MKKAASLLELNPDKWASHNFLSMRSTVSCTLWNSLAWTSNPKCLNLAATWWAISVLRKPLTRERWMAVLHSLDCLFPFPAVHLSETFTRYAILDSCLEELLTSFRGPLPMRGRRAVVGILSAVLAFAGAPLPFWPPCLTASAPSRAGVPTYASVGIENDVCLFVRSNRYYGCHRWYHDSALKNLIANSNWCATRYRAMSST